MCEDEKAEPQEVPIRNIHKESGTSTKKNGDRRELELWIALFCIGIAYLLLIDVVL